MDGTGTTRYVAPDPELDIYTNRKYVNITPAKLPTSVQLSTHNYHQVSSGATMQPTVTYTPSDADIKAERKRICDELMDAITEIAVSLPEHTVIPYPNISARYYGKNIPLEVYGK